MAISYFRPRPSQPPPRSSKPPPPPPPPKRKISVTFPTVWAPERFPLSPFTLEKRILELESQIKKMENP